MAGFEPAAPRSQSECATKLRHTPSYAAPSLTRPAVASRRARRCRARAGVAQWQSPSLPSWPCGFDSRRPLHPLTSGNGRPSRSWDERPWPSVPSARGKWKPVGGPIATTCVGHFPAQLKLPRRSTAPFSPRNTRPSAPGPAERSMCRRSSSTRTRAVPRCAHRPQAWAAPPAYCGMRLGARTRHRQDPGVLARGGDIGEPLSSPSAPVVPRVVSRHAFFRCWDEGPDQAPADGYGR